MSKELIFILVLAGLNIAQSIIHFLSKQSADKLIKLHKEKVEYLEAANMHYAAQCARLLNGLYEARGKPRLGALSAEKGDRVVGINKDKHGVEIIIERKNNLSKR